MSEFWPFQDGKFVVHCRKLKHARKIESWAGCTYFNRYYYPDDHMEIDVIVPRKWVRRAAKVIGVELETEIASFCSSVQNECEKPLLDDNELEECRFYRSVTER